MRALHLALLLLVAAGAFFLREAHAAAYRDAGTDGASTWYVDDPDAAYHLRRIEIALETGDVPQTDRYLNFPAGSPVPWPPLFDGALAGLARVAPRAAGDGEALRGQRLVAFLVHVPPLLGVLATLAVFLATWKLCGTKEPVRVWAALVASAVYASLPIAVWYGGVTRIDHHVATALLLALQLAALAAALRAEELSRATVGALVAGVLAGLSLLVWLASAVCVGLGGAALFARALSADRERASRAVRAGAVYFLAAVVTTMVPAEASPWNEVQPGSLVNLTAGVPRALILAAASFFVLALPGVRAWPRPLRAAAAAVVAGLGALILPGFLAGVREGRDWASRSNLFMDVVDESRPLLGRGDSLDLGLAIQDLGPLVFVFPLAWLAVVLTARRPERFLLVLVSGVLFAMTLAQHRFGNSFAVPFAITIGVALHDLGRRAGRRLLVPAAGLVLAASAFSAAANLRVPDQELEAVRTWRGEVVGGLRWMRANTPSPGAWEDAEAEPAYGVLSAWGLGHLIEYHARRPTIATNFGSFVGEENFRRSARALLAPDPETFTQWLRTLGADYVVVTPRQAGDLKSLARIAGMTAAQRQTLFELSDGVPALSEEARRTALVRLALYAENAPRDAYPGLVRVYAAKSRETTSGRRPKAGEPAGPVLSIYRLVDAEEPPK